MKTVIYSAIAVLLLGAQPALAAEETFDFETSIQRLEDMLAKGEAAQVEKLLRPICGKYDDNFTFNYIYGKALAQSGLNIMVPRHLNRALRVKPDNLGVDVEKEIYCLLYDAYRRCFYFDEAKNVLLEHRDVLGEALFEEMATFLKQRIESFEKAVKYGNAVCENESVSVSLALPGGWFYHGDLKGGIKCKGRSTRFDGILDAKIVRIQAITYEEGQEFASGADREELVDKSFDVVKRKLGLSKEEKLVPLTISGHKAWYLPFVQKKVVDCDVAIAMIPFKHFMLQVITTVTEPGSAEKLRNYVYNNLSITLKEKPGR